MNLFYLDENHDTNARYHIDKHVIKMILEAAEMLCKAHWVQDCLGYVPRILTKEEYREVLEFTAPYKSLPPEERLYPYLGQASHYQHPSTVWVRSSYENYAWTYCYMEALEAERKFRNPNGVIQHKAVTLMRKVPLLDIPDVGFTKFALAMKVMKECHPEYYDEENPVQSYRYFYMADKSNFASWKSREQPFWWDQEWANAHALRD